MRKANFFKSTMLMGIIILLLTGCNLVEEKVDVKTEDEDDLVHDLIEHQLVYELEAGVTKPIYLLEETIIEELYVETEVDSDNDGEFDKVAISLIRPKTDEGVKVPIIFEMSPYQASYVHRNMIKNRIMGANRKAFIDSSTDMAAYYVQRGYAVVFGQSLGTYKSEGCVSVGGNTEALAAKSVIDWLNGRADAFAKGDKKVVANWSTGNVSMSGGSYDGSLAMAVAQTRVEGLKTIVPIAAPSNWYDYFLINDEYVRDGTPSGLAKMVSNRNNTEACQPLADKMRHEMYKPDPKSDFWTERNYLLGVPNYQVSVLLGYGLQDWNVPMYSFESYWRVLEDNKITRKAVLYNGGHTEDIPEWREIEHKWFDYWLYDIDNGIVEEPVVSIANNDTTWTYKDTWPDPKAKEVKFMLSNEGKLLTEEDDNTSTNHKQFLKDISGLDEFTLIDKPDEDMPYRLIYMSNPLKNDIQLSGTPSVTISASFEGKHANIGAFLVDYGDDEAQLITRGSISAQNRTPEKGKQDVDPSESYLISWEMFTSSYVLKEGHRIGLVLIGSDSKFSFRSAAELTTTVTPGLSELILPLVGEGF